MTSIELTSITGSITTPYQIFACDVYGNNCILIATIGTTVPPSNTIILPSQFNTAPAVGIKIMTFDGCERFEIFNCSVLPPTPTPTMTHTPTPTPTPTPTGIMLNNYLVTQCGGIGVEIISVPSLSGYYLGSDGNCWRPLYLSLDPPTISYVNTYNNCLECLGITQTPTPTQTITPTLTNTPTQTPTPTTAPLARFLSPGLFYSQTAKFSSFTIPSNQIRLSGFPNDTLTIEVSWTGANTMSGTTTLNTNSIPENITSTFTVTLNSLGNADITGSTTRVGPSVYGQKIFKLTILSSSGSWPISSVNKTFIQYVTASPPSTKLCIGNNSISYGNNTLACSNILAQSSYYTNGLTLNVGQYLYDNNGVLVNGGNNWIALWYGTEDLTNPTVYRYIQVDPTGLILNLGSC